MDMRRGLCCKQWSLEDMTCLFVCLFESCDLWVGSGIGIGCVKIKGPFLFWVRWERKCEVNVLCYRPVCVC